MSNFPLLLTDRTTIETDWTCPRKRWWYKEFDGTGIVPVKEAGYFKLGRDIHANVARLLEGDSLEAVLVDPQDDWVVGMSAAFSLFILPKLREKYTFPPLMIEKELVLDRTPLWIACTGDFALRRKSDGVVEGFDFKSASYVGPNWTAHWPYAVQMHINLAAMNEELGEKVEKMTIIGLQKGQIRSGWDCHPYVSAWSDGDAGWTADWNRNWTRRPTREFPGGIVEWVRAQGEEVAINQFPFSAPIFLNERLLKGLIRQITAREKQVELVRPICQTDDEAKDLFFGQHFMRCRPEYGQADSSCPYLSACHNATVNADPLASGDYVRRTPHHDLERTITGEQDS